MAKVTKLRCVDKMTDSERAAVVLAARSIPVSRLYGSQRHGGSATMTP